MIDASNGSLAQFFDIQEAKQFKTRESSKNRVPKGHFNIEKNTFTTVAFRFSHIVYIIGT